MQTNVLKRFWMSEEKMEGQLHLKDLGRGLVILNNSVL
jgi:hypothetical protein